MPNFDLSHQPRFELVHYDTDTPITEETLTQLLNGRTGITLCIRPAAGHENRGGHFFCIEEQAEGSISLETIEGDPVECFSVADMVSFINHCSGLRYSREMQLHCQNNINFRTD